MAIGLLPSDIIRQVLIRIGAYRGQPVDIEASYVEVDPAGDSVSESFVPSSIRDQLTAIEEEIAVAVSGSDHPWRNIIAGVTSGLANGDLVPTFGAAGSGFEIIGEYGQVRSADSPFFTFANDLTVSEIQAITQNPNVYNLSIFSYAFENGKAKSRRIYHTASSFSAGALVLIDVCVYNYLTRKNAIFANEALLFPGAANAYLSGVMSTLKNTDAQLAELSGLYQPRYEAWLSAFQAGRTE